MSDAQRVYVNLGKRQSGGRPSPAFFLGGLLLSVARALQAAWQRIPGAGFHIALVTLFLRFFPRLPSKYLLRQIAAPMDSFRYFEFDFFWQSFSNIDSVGRYLDVSSPRLFTWRVLQTKGCETATVSNPDVNDLSATRFLYAHTGLGEQCDFRADVVSDLPAHCMDQDFVVCISVLEHIAEDVAAAALHDMWNMVKPGGRLLLSIPCAKKGFSEYVDFNEYGLLSTDRDGYVFGQRFYDEKMIEAQIYAIVGKPARMAVFGEQTSGRFFSNRQEKLNNPKYPFWTEPQMIADEYRYFDSVGDLPGIGVVAFEFIK